MAPFLHIGRTVRNRLQLVGLHLQAAPASCNGCNIWMRNCPMRLEVMTVAKHGAMEHSACILCGICIDLYPKDAMACCYRRPA